MSKRCSAHGLPALVSVLVATWLLAACATPAKPRSASPIVPTVVVDADLATRFGTALAGTPADVQRAGRGLRIVLPAQLLFVTDTATVAPQASTALAPMLAVMTAHRGLQVTVRAHTDAIGSVAFNEEFSRQRAAAMRLWLMEHGVPGEAIEAEGAGERAPLADNTTPVGRERNRRVELLVGPRP